MNLWFFIVDEYHLNNEEIIFNIQSEFSDNQVQNNQRNEEDIERRDNIYLDFKSLVGPLGIKLAETIQILDISDLKYSIHSFGLLMFQFAAYFTYKKSIFGEDITNKIFNKKDLDEKYNNPQNKAINIQEFVS